MKQTKAITTPRQYEEGELLSELAASIKAKGLSGTARIIGVSKSHLKYTVEGRYHLGDLFAQKIGYRRRVIFEKLPNVKA